MGSVAKLVVVTVGKTLSKGAVGTWHFLTRNAFGKVLSNVLVFTGIAALWDKITGKSAAQLDAVGQYSLDDGTKIIERCTAILADGKISKDEYKDVEALHNMYTSWYNSFPAPRDGQDATNTATTKADYQLMNYVKEFLDVADSIMRSDNVSDKKTTDIKRTLITKCKI